MLTISDEVLKNANMTPQQLLQEVAVYLYSKNKLSFGQARKLAGMDVLQFQELLYISNVPVHYDVSDLESDYKAIKRESSK
jgi:predicted HTH domain antitoxin